MNDKSAKVQALRPDREVMTKQKLPYFVGISGQTVGASGLSMHLVVIPPGARAEPHLHIGYETGIYVLEGTVCTRWGAELEHEVISQAGDFLFVPPGVPHEAINLTQLSLLAPSWQGIIPQSKTWLNPMYQGREAERPVASNEARGDASPFH